MRYIFIYFSLISMLLSAPAFNGLREFKNSDGTTFMAKARGTHILNWIETVDGEILKYNKETKNFEYATIKDDKLIASGTKYEIKNSRRARSLAGVNKLFYNDLKRLWKIKHQKMVQKRYR